MARSASSARRPTERAEGRWLFARRTRAARKIRVLNALRYLGRLKGLAFTAAEDRANELLKRMNLHEHRSKKVEDLSRDMTQLVQFVAAIVHDPEVLLLDEPLNGTDLSVPTEQKLQLLPRSLPAIKPAALT